MLFRPPNFCHGEENLSGIFIGIHQTSYNFVLSVMSQNLKSADARFIWKALTIEEIDRRALQIYGADVENQEGKMHLRKCDNRKTNG